MVEEERTPISEQTREVAGRSAPPPAAAPDYGAQAASSIAEATRQMSSFVAHFSEVARADAAVGPVQSSRDHTLVPLAAVSLQAGFGMGFGGGTGPDEAKGQGSGGGGGGGGRGSARVVAIADISDGGIRVVPVPDVTSLALGMMALIGIGMLTRRGKAPSKQLMRMLNRE